MQWLPAKPWSCCIVRCAPYGTGALPWPSKWPAMEVHLFAAATNFDCFNRSLGPCYCPFPSYCINLIIRILLAAANDKECRFGHHCCRRASPNSFKHRDKHKLINFYITLLNLLNCFDGGIETSMHKDVHPSGGVGSSNPRRWRGERRCL
jgi:hypothetical protein